MGSIATYVGIVHNGKIELSTPVNLPEGSEVYLVAPEVVTEGMARRKANGWLIGYVGNMLMADHGMLAQVGQDWVWRFQVFITSLAHEPWGPIGYVEIDATKCVVINDLYTKKTLMDNGRNFKRPV